MKIFIRILLTIFIISIAAPFIYTAIVYNNYWSVPLSLLVWAVSFFVLIFSTVLLTLLDKKIKKRYLYCVIAFSSVIIFIFSLPVLNNCSNYLFIKRNEVNLQFVISEMKNKNIRFIDDTKSLGDTNKIKDILRDLEIQNAQLTTDGSVIFMEGGFLEADGWCYSESNTNPQKYYNRGPEVDSYERITQWSHSHGNWYKWNTH